MTWILCYDIEDDKLRQKLARYLEKSGWERLQKSVFAQGLEPKIFNRYFVKVKELTENKLQPSDKIYVWGLSDSQFSEAAVLGSAYDSKWIQNKYVVMYMGEEELLK